MTCEKCGSELTKRTSATRKSFVIPFSCKQCGSIKLNYTGVRDVVYLYQYPPPEKTKGGILLVDDGVKYLGYKGACGSYREELRPNRAVVMAFGPGYFDTKDHYFVPTKNLNVGDEVFFGRVPWKYELLNDDGNVHIVTLCGIKDVYAFAE